MRNVKTREGMEFWDKICALKHYGFIHSPDNSRVLKAEGIGNWIDKFEAQGVVDQAQDEINRLRAERDALQQRLTAADERADELDETDRSPKDYAIEHAEYMAKSADDVLAKFQAYGLTLLAVDEGGDDGEGELFEAIDYARGDLQESMVDLRSMVYEFRKRRTSINAKP